MAQDDLYVEFLKKLKSEKSDTEIQTFIANLLNFGATELYTLMIMFLTEEDFAAVEAIKDDAEAEKETAARFKLRTSMSPEEFIIQLRDEVAKGYLFPVLNANKK